MDTETARQTFWLMVGMILGASITATGYGLWNHWGTSIVLGSLLPALGIIALGAYLLDTY